MDGESPPPLSTHTDAVENPKLLQIVFPLLPPNLVAVCACVSRSWRHVADSDSIWSDFCVRRWPSFAKSSLCRPDGEIGDPKSIFSRLSKAVVRKEFVSEDFEILLTFRYKDQILHSACLPFQNGTSFHPFTRDIPLVRSTDPPLFKQYLLWWMCYPEVDKPLLSDHNLPRFQRKVCTLLHDIHRQSFVEVIVVKKEDGSICKVLQDIFSDGSSFEHNPNDRRVDDGLIMHSQSWRTFASQGLNKLRNDVDVDSICAPVTVYGTPVKVGADEVKLELSEFEFCIDSYALIGDVTRDGLDQLPLLPWI